MKKILISDDSITVRKVIEMLLKPLNYVLFFAETGKDTLAKVMNEQFDLAIIDYSLPDVVGTKIIKEIKEINPMLPLLLMISNKEQETFTKLQEGMFDDYIEKPFDSQSFLNKVDTLLKKTVDAKIISKEMKEEAPVELNLENIGIEIGEEFVNKTPREKLELEEKENVAFQKLDSEIKETLEEIEEIEEIEELSEEEVITDVKGEDVEKVEEITIDELLKEDMVNLGMVDTETKGFDLMDLSIEEEKKEEEKVTTETKSFVEEEKSINLDDFFSDLNDILKEEKAEKEEKAVIQEKDFVKPVIEEVAKELKEIEMITEKIEKTIEPIIEVAEENKVDKVSEEDIWNFDLVLPERKVATSQEFVKPTFETKDIENIVREITYDIVEKIAWEIVPEIVDTIMKDKFNKKP